MRVCWMVNVLQSLNGTAAQEECCARVMLGLTRTHAGRHDVKVAIASRDCVTRIASQVERCHACGESFVCSDGDHVISTNIACFGHLVAYDEFSTGMNHSRS
jgi:hypothetical protein